MVAYSKANDLDTKVKTIILDNLKEQFNRVNQEIKSLSPGTPPGK